MIDKITKKDMFADWQTGVFDDKKDPEGERVEGVISAILSHLSDKDEMGYHFGECDGHDVTHLEELLKDLLDDQKWRTIYDSCYFPVSDGGSYSIIEVAQSSSGDYFYLSVSLGGSIGASALTEYFKVPMTGKWGWSA